MAERGCEIEPKPSPKPKVNKRGRPVRLRDDFKPFAPRSHLSASAKRIVLNVFHQTQKIYPNENVHKRTVKTALITGLKESTIQDIRKSYSYEQPMDTGLSEVAAGKRQRGKPTMTEKIGGVGIDAIRAKAHGFYRRHKVPRLGKLLNAVNEDETLPSFKKASFIKLMHGIGFRNSKRNHGEGYFERDDVIARRHTYLREIRRHRDNGRVIYYLHVTWMNEGEDEWCEKTWKGKSLRLTILHVVSIQGSFLACKASNNDEDMTSDFISERMEEIYPRLQPNSIIVINSLPYLSETTEQYLTSEHQKEEIKEWLLSKNIKFPTDALKLELLHLVNVEKSKVAPKYVIDKRAKELGFDILRLPPYHCELNPTEMVWLQIVNDVKQINGIRKLSQVEAIVAESVSSITPKQWSNYFGKVIEKEDILWEMDNLLDEPFTCEKPTGGELSSSDSSENEEEDYFLNSGNGHNNVVVKIEMDSFDNENKL